MLSRLGAVRPATWVMWALIAAYVSYFTQRSLDVHHGLGTSAYDSALYDQGVWLLSRFRAPFVTLMGRNLFGDHASFILIGLVPFYWIAPGAWILFFSQSLLLSVAAFPLYAYARRVLRSDWLGVLFGATFLLHPAVSWTNLENFHPDSYLGLFIGLALLGALERRWGVYWIGVGLAVLVKEDVALVVVPLGIWVAASRSARRGLLTIAAAIAVALIGTVGVMRSLTGHATRNAWRIPFGGPWGFFKTAFTHPTRIADHFRSDGRPWYVWQMLAPTAFMFWRRWGVAAISGLVIFTNILSTYWYQYHVQYHYSLIAVPALSFGTVYALTHVPSAGRWNNRVLSCIVGLSALAAAYAWAPFPGLPKEPSTWPPTHPVAVAARELIAEVPDGASVAAHYGITPHLAYRSEIYQFPNPFRVVLYGTDVSLEGTREVARAERVEYVFLQVNKEPEAAQDWSVIAPAFELVDSNTYWELWRRNRAIPLPPLP